jgi:hypothetical protein
MKKELIILLTSVMTLCSGSFAFARAERWSLLGENLSGQYFVDRASLDKAMQKEKDGIVKNVRTKALFRNVSFIRLLNEHYDQKLGDADRAHSCELIVSLNLQNNTYKVDHVAVFSKKGKTLEKKNLKEAFIPIPPKTFMDALCQDAKAKEVMQAGDKVHAEREPGQKNDTVLSGRETQDRIMKSKGRVK